MLPVRYLFTVDRTALPDLIPQPLPCLFSLLQSLVQHACRRRDGSACAAAGRLGMRSGTAAGPAGAARPPAVPILLHPGPLKSPVSRPGGLPLAPPSGRVTDQPPSSQSACCLGSASSKRDPAPCRCAARGCLPAFCRLVGRSGTLASAAYVQGRVLRGARPPQALVAGGRWQCASRRRSCARCQTY